MDVVVLLLSTALAASAAWLCTEYVFNERSRYSALLIVIAAIAGAVLYALGDSIWASRAAANASTLHRTVAEWFWVVISDHHLLLAAVTGFVLPAVGHSIKKKRE